MIDSWINRIPTKEKSQTGTLILITARIIYNVCGVFKGKKSYNETAAQPYSLSEKLTEINNPNTWKINYLHVFYAN